MNFGHVELPALEAINFSLPPEPGMNAGVLGGKPAEQCRFHLGLSSWGRPAWLGSLYPKKAKEKDFLCYYGQHFNTIELNATHYKVYGEADTLRWKERVKNPEMQFCPKMFKGLTHAGSLLGKEKLIDEFLQGVEGLGEQLGPVWIQFSDKFGRNRSKELEQFLQQLPGVQTCFIELREPGWFTDASIFSLLKEQQIGAVITDAAGRRDVLHMHLTVPKLFVRFVANDGHPTDETRIIEWAKRIQSWKKQGLQEVYFFLHSWDDNELLLVAKRAIELFNQHCDAGLKPLQLWQENTLF